MNLLLLVVAVGLAGASPLEDNKVCQPHSRPWHVHLHGGVSCSGALVDPWWIVTSLECSRDPYSTIATLGEHDTTVDEGTEQHILVEDAIRLGPYRSPLNSLALLRLAKPARITKYVQPIPLSSRCPQPGESCHVSGWGSTIPYRNWSPHLKCITVPIVDDQTCMNALPDSLYWSGTMVCAGRADTDNCLSDSATVMVCDGHLQGVQWFNLGCRNPADPTIYSKLCLYNKWINNAMDSYVPVMSTALPDTTLLVMP